VEYASPSPSSPLTLHSDASHLLSLVSKSIIDLHGGTLSVSSEGIPGKGATFTICLIIHSYGQSSLPLTGVMGAASVAPTAPLPFTPISKISPTSLPEGLEMTENQRNIEASLPPVALCVDDSPLNRKFLGKFLGKYFRVIYCVNGLEAVEHVKKTLLTVDCVSIIFMDNVMPVMDGLEATSQIRSLGFLGPIVGVTGNCLPEQLEEFSQKGATMIVQKPIKLESFGKLIYGKLFRPSLPLTPPSHSLQMSWAMPHLKASGLNDLVELKYLAHPISALLKWISISGKLFVRWSLHPLSHSSAPQTSFFLPSFFPVPAPYCRVCHDPPCPSLSAPHKASFLSLLAARYLFPSWTMILWVDVS
jgi:CheY-like chemotaxis protein